MNKLLEKAFSKAAKLPEGEQAQLADALLSVIEGDIPSPEEEQEWDALVARPESKKLLERLAQEAIEEDKAGKTLPLDPSDISDSQH